MINVEVILGAIPIALSIIMAIHKHGERLGKIEAKLDLLFDDVRSLERYK